MEKKQLTTIHTLLILDESGSMQSIYKQALTGANETIQSTKAAQERFPDQDHRFTFVTFNTDGPCVKTIVDDQPVKGVKELTGADYRPDACTPLYDAMGKSITALEQKVKEGDRVLVTVITDGLENASREYSGRAVKAMIDRLREKGWTFVYIGANQDAVEVAKDLHIRNSLEFCASIEGTVEMFQLHRRSKDIYYDKVSRNCLNDEDFFNEKAAVERVTPDKVETLQPNQIFVFGSNLAGHHDGGAAYVAYRKFGAVYGQGVGLQGHCYAIPTMQGGVDTIRPYVDEFIEFAADHQDLTFFVTCIGCGVAGFKPEQIAPLFERAIALPNVCLPKSFWKVLNQQK